MAGTIGATDVAAFIATKHKAQVVLAQQALGGKVTDTTCFHTKQQNEMEGTVGAGGIVERGSSRHSSSPSDYDTKHPRIGNRHAAFERIGIFLDSSARRKSLGGEEYRWVQTTLAGPTAFVEGMGGSALVTLGTLGAKPTYVSIN